MDSTEIFAVIGILALVVFAAFLAAAETALTNLPRAKAIALKEEGRRGAGSLLHLLEHRERYLNPVLLLILVCHLTSAALVGMIAESFVGGVGIAIAVVVTVAVIYVVAEAAPKSYALQHPDRMALLVAPVVALLAGFWPVRVLTRALIGVANLLIPGKGRKQGPVVSEDELLALAEVAVEEGEIESEERTLIRSIIDFGDTVAREVMVPRPDMVSFDCGASASEAMETVLACGYSRVPVAGDGGVDDIVGLVYAKDLMRAAREGKSEERVDTMMRVAHFVPETKKVSELLREMQEKKQHMAIVVDEYGGTAGLVTLEDLIEELVGEIVDEYDVEDPFVERLPNGDLRVNGRLSLDELNEQQHLDLPTGDWDTVGGLVFNLLGHVPVEGESVEVDGHRLHAERIVGRRIHRVRITPRPHELEPVDA
jgi:CBS domain containing-hemolysin-like protein